MPIPAAQTPYNVPALKVVPAPPTEGPLFAFERDQLERLINQVENSPERVRAAFFAHYAKLNPRTA